MGLNVLRELLREAGRRWRVADSVALPEQGRSGTLPDPATSTAEIRLRIAGALDRIERDALPATVVVPIHNAPGEVSACITALLRHTPEEYRILLLEDASPDPRVDLVLAECWGRPNVEIHRNDRNLGFTRTVNRGIEIAGRSDVVLLNSDTEVTPRWMENLRLAAYSSERVATATPLSNNAGAFSAPEADKDNKLPDWLSCDDFGRLVTQSSMRAYPQVPTGNGFCMYVRRAAIDRIGSFDAEAFPVGYGEENDFCMRAVRDGWTHVIDDATMIHHVRSASFGQARNDLLKQGRAVLDARYPEYKRLVRGFAHNAPLRAVRERIGAALAESAASGRPVAPRLLFAWLDSDTGGHDHPSGWEPLALRHKEGFWELHAVRGSGAELLERAGRRAAKSEDQSGETGMLAAWLVLYAVEAVRAFGSGPEAEPLRTACFRLNVPFTSA